MKRSRTKWGVIIVGAVMALTLGAIGVASAASSPTSTRSPNASTQAGQGYGPGGDGRGAHDGRGDLSRGGGDLAEALATLGGKDQATIMQQREAGKSYADIAKASGVSEASLLAEATKLETAELDAAVKAGQLTEAQRTKVLSGLQAHLKEELTETGTLHGGHGDGDGPFGAGGSSTGADAGATTAPTTTRSTSSLTY